MDEAGDPSGANLLAEAQAKAREQAAYAQLQAGGGSGSIFSWRWTVAGFKVLLPSPVVVAITLHIYSLALLSYKYFKIALVWIDYFKLVLFYKIPI